MSMDMPSTTTPLRIQMDERDNVAIVANTPEQFAAFQAAEFTRWKTLIETRKITVD